MTNENTPAGAMTGANSNRESAAHVITIAAAVINLENSFLRTLLVLPTARILTVVDALDPEDIHGPHHRIILDVIVRNARSQTNRGDGDCPIDPVIIQRDLMRAGTLDAVKSVLLTVATGDPAPAAWGDDLATGFRENRLRRACLTVGEALTRAGCDGGHADPVRVLGNLPRLLVFAQRAGLDTEEVDR